MALDDDNDAIMGSTLSDSTRDARCGFAQISLVFGADSIMLFLF